MRSFGVVFVAVVACSPSNEPARAPSASEGSAQAPSAAGTPGDANAPDAGTAEPSPIAPLPPAARPEARAIAKSCADGRGADCLALGVAFANGALGLAADETRAADLYQRACDHGEIRGCNNLAVEFERGQGRPVDLTRAFDLYQRNCDEKHALGCRNLGRFYRDGLGVPSNAAKAKTAFRAARDLSERDCTARVAEGCSNLGFMYRSGAEGLPKNEKRAAEYLQRACDMGYHAVCRLVRKTK
jgi:TPR repeat protein